MSSCEPDVSLIKYREFANQLLIQYKAFMNAVNTNPNLYIPSIKFAYPFMTIQKIASIHDVCTRVIFTRIHKPNANIYVYHINLIVQLLNAFSYEDENGLSSHESHTLYDNRMFQNEPEINVELLQRMCHQVHTIIHMLKLDRYNGVLSTNVFNEPFGYEFSMAEDCCVCLEKTLTKTHCNHFYVWNVSVK